MPATGKLTPAQERALDQLANGPYDMLPVSQCSPRAAGPRFEVFVAPGTADALERRGLVEFTVGGLYIRITKAGRAALRPPR